MNTPLKTIEWSNGKVRFLDQTRLPVESVVLEIDDYRDMIEAIRSLRIRGAPALGVATAYGIVLGAREAARDAGANGTGFAERVREAAREIAASRPTAVNVAWAAARMERTLANHDEPEAAIAALLEEADRIVEEDLAAGRAMGAHGAALIPDDATVLTHCNAGGLATSGYGTALGVIKSAREDGKSVRVMATETRPLLQGARLTSWELVRDGVETTLITDSMAGHFLKSGAVTCVVVGADRIAMNGDVANKIGTYTLAVLAKENGAPFYVAAPVSTIDPAVSDGGQIPIEERRPEEVTRWGGVQTAPEGVNVANPAFDVTPNRYVTAIITERGVARAPYGESLARMLA